MVQLMQDNTPFQTYPRKIGSIAKIHSATFPWNPSSIKKQLQSCNSIISSQVIHAFLRSIQLVNDKEFCPNILGGKFHMQRELSSLFPRLLPRKRHGDHLLQFRNPWNPCRSFSSQVFGEQESFLVDEGLNLLSVAHFHSGNFNVCREVPVQSFYESRVSFFD